MSPMPTPPPLKKDPVRIDVCGSADDLARHAAQGFVAQAAAAFGAHGRFDVAISACAAPRRMCEMLAQEHLSFQVVWPGVHVHLTDAWCVPPGDDRDHLTRLRAAFAEVPLPVENLHAMPAGDDPEAAAAGADRALRERAGRGPVFDLVVLGLGDDGHIAGLMPGSPLIEENDRLVGVARPGSDPARLTLTPAALNSARTVMVLASGERKADAVKAVLGAGAKGPALPAHALRPRDGQVIWLIDEAAASHMADPGQGSAT